ncbi:phosphatase PAP2 family protein [Cohnella hashimotonis]|uniref:Phosphatase PAP2 family protein n=1 Tax=Cohnella hashimotonis TaxID=2826895 RepID=A0ABT6TFF5_9BACL|nr:phosphatase PAP2 family protein [Cohnella hashimotonis]MDI4645576.1 phosphatase PAP2 family protein [Cohnella hashimotonis]
MTLNKAQKRTILIAVAIAALLFATITSLRAGGYAGWDRAVAAAAADTRASGWTSLWRAMNDMGSAAVVAAVALLSAACWWRLRSWKIAVSFVGVVLSAYVLQSALKSAFGYERPDDAWGITHDGYGYPSGNATIAGALYGWWMLLGWLELRGRVQKIAVCVLACVLIAATGWSRIYFSVHYLSDVCAGFCAGGICALTAATICFWRRS